MIHVENNMDKLGIILRSQGNKMLTSFKGKNPFCKNLEVFLVKEIEI